MGERVIGHLGSVVLGTPDPRSLARFWEQLLDFTRWDDSPEWVRIGPHDNGRPGLSFQLEEGYVAPVWPYQEGAQQMTMHLDVYVQDLPAAAARAVRLGARQLPHQPQDDVVVMADPHGHVFCLFVLAP